MAYIDQVNEIGEPQQRPSDIDDDRPEVELSDEERRAMHYGPGRESMGISSAIDFFRPESETDQTKEDEQQDIDEIEPVDEQVGDEKQGTEQRRPDEESDGEKTDEEDEVDGLTFPWYLFEGATIAGQGEQKMREYAVSQIRREHGLSAREAHLELRRKLEDKINDKILNNQKKQQMRRSLHHTVERVYSFKGGVKAGAELDSNVLYERLFDILKEEAGADSGTWAGPIRTREQRRETIQDITRNLRELGIPRSEIKNQIEQRTEEDRAVSNEDTDMHTELNRAMNAVPDNVAWNNRRANHTLQEDEVDELDRYLMDAVDEAEVDHELEKELLHRTARAYIAGANRNIRGEERETANDIHFKLQETIDKIQDQGNREALNHQTHAEILKKHIDNPEIRRRLTGFVRDNVHGPVANSASRERKQAHAKGVE